MRKVVVLCPACDGQLALPHGQNGRLTCPLCKRPVEVSTMGAHAGMSAREMLEALPVMGEGKTSLIHRPLYNSLRDEFELPCRRNAPDKTTLGGAISDFERWSEESRTPVVIAGLGDHVHFLWRARDDDDGWGPPGAHLCQVVRTGADDYWTIVMCIGRRARTSSDPDFSMQSMSRAPQLWVKHMKAVVAAWERNPNYREVAQTCPHRP
jgi:hypothetical protein